jgi:hypothetical protein
MGREVRRVPKDWKHPVYDRDTAPYQTLIGKHRALFSGFDPEEQVAWDEGARKWAEGLRPDGDEWVRYEERPLIDRGRHDTWENWTGARPNRSDFMPTWNEEELTHLMMYETTTEGTPISPAFETGRELARWLADNNASSFGDRTAPYETWFAWIEQDVGPELLEPEENLTEKPV